MSEIIRTSEVKRLSEPVIVGGTKYSSYIVQEVKNGTNVVYFPDLTEEERARRHKVLERAVENYFRKLDQIEMEKQKGE